MIIFSRLEVFPCGCILVLQATVTELSDNLQARSHELEEKQLQQHALQMDVKRLESELLISVSTVELHEEELHKLRAALETSKLDALNTEEETSTQVMKQQN